MGCLSRISQISLQLFILLTVGMFVTRGLQHMATEKYAPGDMPHDRFRVVMVAPGNTNNKHPSYVVYPWIELKEMKKDIQAKDFMLPEQAGSIKDSEGGLDSFTVLASQEPGQLIKVKRVDNDYETICRYRVTGEGIIPISFRRTAPNIALRGLLVGFIVAGLAGIPLKRLFHKPEDKAPLDDNQEG